MAAMRFACQTCRPHREQARSHNNNPLTHSGLRQGRFLSYRGYPLEMIGRLLSGREFDD